MTVTLSADYKKHCLQMSVVTSELQVYGIVFY